MLLVWHWFRELASLFFRYHHDVYALLRIVGFVLIAAEHGDLSRAGIVGHIFQVGGFKT